MSSPIVVVTGAASGIGLSVCGYLHEQGYNVWGLDVSEAPKDIVFPFYKADLASESAIHDFADHIKSQNLKVIGLVNNAAIQVESDAIATSRTDLERLFAVNVFSVFSLLKELKAVLAQGASVVNMTSVHVRATSKGLAAYVASKGAMSALTRALALELADSGVRVNSVGPGAVDTPMLRRGLSRNGNATEMFEKLKKGSPLGRVGETLDIAHMVGFLLDGKLSGNITGQEFFVDSGVLAKLASE